MKRTELAAKEIFEKNHVIVFEALQASDRRVDEIFAYHKCQKEMFDRLTLSNQEAIKMYYEIKRVFKEESEAFFAERIKWKSDV